MPLQANNQKGGKELEKYCPNVIVDNIDALTRPQWLEMRKKGIGGSDCACVLGFSPYKTRKELYWEKLGQEQQEPDNWVQLEVGNRLEELVIEIFRKKNPGWKVFRDRRMFSHPQYPWMLADCDAFTQDPRTGDIYVLEIKTGTEEAIEKWGSKNSNVIPPHYEVQGRHYMCVTGTKGVIFAFLGGSTEAGYRQRYLLRNLEMEEHIIKAEQDFWMNYVVKGREPKYQSNEHADKVMSALKRFYKKRTGTKKLPGQFQQNLENVVGLDAAIADLNKKIKALKAQKDKQFIPVLEYLQGCDGVLQLPDGSGYSVRVTERENTGIKSDSLINLQMEYPEVYLKYVNTSKSQSWKVKKEC